MHRASRRQTYLAYELCGFFVYSVGPNRQVASALRERVLSLVLDAPSLSVWMDPEEEMQIYPLNAQYARLPERDGQLQPIVRCGRGLTHAPVVSVRLGDGRMILSQLLTAGRLSPSFSRSARYGAHYDAELVRLMLNILDALTRR